MTEPLPPRILFSTFPPVSAPSGLTVTALSTTAVRLDYKDNSPNEVHFFIERSTDNRNFRKVASTEANQVSFTDTNLQPGTTYFYAVRASARTANSTPSNHASVTTPLTDPFATLDANTGRLSVIGTAANDAIRVSASATTVFVAENGLIESFTQAAVQSISINALDGNDRVSIGAGILGVYMRGGNGNDTLLGSPGNDRLDGGPGNDSIKGGDGNDYLIGGIGRDTCYGQNGNDQIFGGADNDKLVGGDGDDTINGGPGNDRLYGDAGDDSLLSGGGNDRISDTGP